MNQDSDQLRLLSIFHYIIGGLIALAACIPIIHLIFGFLMLSKPDVFSQGPPPRILGWFFILFASVFILVGWILAGLVLWSGRCLSRRLNYNYCFAMACVVCVFLPFGTVLGILTIIVLMRPTVKGLFLDTTAVR